MSNNPAFQASIDAIDNANREDPNHVLIDGVQQPVELIYSQRMSQRLEQFAPDSSEALQLAVRSQHIQRWKSPRDQYPAGRDGYRQWRKDLGQFHANTAAALMAAAGYDAETTERVQVLLQKKGIKRDPEVQALEDVACLVFLEHYLSDFAAKHEDEKLIDIIQKTWRKMSESGHDAALKLPLDPALMPLIERALQG